MTHTKNALRINFIVKAVSKIDVKEATSAVFSVDKYTQLFE